MNAPSAIPDAFDHLIWSVPELAAGIDDLERRLGVRAAIGGRHAKWGTHNALLALGGHRYLEILADDPAASTHRRPFGLDRRDLPAITHWMAACSLPDAADRARERGFEAGEVEQFGRERPDGSRLEWRLSTRLDLPGDGTRPDSHRLARRGTPRASRPLRAGGARTGGVHGRASRATADRVDARGVWNLDAGRSRARPAASCGDSPRRWRGRLALSDPPAPEPPTDLDRMTEAGSLTRSSVRRRFAGFTGKQTGCAIRGWLRALERLASRAESRGPSPRSPPWPLAASPTSSTGLGPS